MNSPLVLFAFTSLVLVVAYSIVRALACPRPTPPYSLEATTLLAYAGAEHKLGRLVRIQTVSHFSHAEENDDAFASVKTELMRMFPLAAARLLWTFAGPRAILIEWPGSDGALDPVILCAHYDVVPPGDEAGWNFGPFSGDIVDGFVLGRGSQDTKVTLVAIMESAERLLTKGFTPKRSLYFAFGGDEETGGLDGARSIAALLQERGISASFLLDEGGPVARGIIGFVKRPVALVGISEKGYVDVAVEADGESGHAAMPPRHTASGVVAKAVRAVEDHPFPARITYTLAGFLSSLRPYVSFPYRWLFSNLFITWPMVRHALSRSPGTNALVRTTAAATMLSGSVRENVLPHKARAVFNVRILPGTSVRQALERIERQVARHGARAGFAHHGHANEALPESSIDHEGYRAIRHAVDEAHPEAICVPFLFMAATDTKHYRDVAKAMYRFSPISQERSDLGGIHGPNEKISVENVRRCCMFYEKLMESL